MNLSYTLTRFKQAFTYGTWKFLIVIYATSHYAVSISIIVASL